MRTQLHQQLLNLDYCTRQTYGRIEIFSDRSSKSQIHFIATRPIPRSLSLFWQLLHCLESQLGGNLFDLAEEYYDLVLDTKLNGESASLSNHLNSLPSELIHTLEIAAECQAKVPDPQIRDRLFQLIQKLESITPLDTNSFAETALPLVRDVILQARETGKSVAEVVESYRVEESDPLRCNIPNCLFEDAVANLPQGIRLARVIGNPDVSFLAQLESQPSLDSIKVSSLYLSEGTIVRVIKCLWEQQLDFDIENCKELSLPQSAMCRTEAGQLCLVPREALQFLGNGDAALSTSQRLVEIERDLVELIEEFEPTQAVMEMPFFGRHIKAAGGVLQAVGIINLVCCREADIEPVQLHQSSWKAHLGNGRATKGEVAEIIATLFDMEKLPVDDSVDAIAIGYAGLCGLTNNIS